MSENKEVKVMETQSAYPSTMLATGDIKATLATMPVSERIEFLKKISEYVGADTEDVNKFLNVPVKVCGVLIHDATVNKGETVDPNTGELIPNYITAKRTVFKLENGKVLGFVSMSVSSYVEDFLIPAFGLGDWVDGDGNPQTVTLKFQQITSKGGRAYSIQVLG